MEGDRRDMIPRKLSPLKAMATEGIYPNLADISGQKFQGFSKNMKSMYTHLSPYAALDVFCLKPTCNTPT